MKSAIASLLSRVLVRVLQDERVEQRLWEIVHAPRSFDRRAGNLGAELARRTARQTAEYIEQCMADVPAFDLRMDLLKHSLSRTGAGLYLEFGVAGGESINFIADNVQTTVHGFDSFEGLPEYWIDGAGKGAMTTRGRLPVVRPNVKLHPGWFEDVLPPFVAQHREPVAFMHVDCDLYSSTRSVLEHLAPRIRPGSVIQFDEYFNYPGWRNHEFKAFQEFTARHGVRYRYIGYARSGYSVAVVIQEQPRQAPPADARL